MKYYKVKKILSNNVLLAETSHKEYILMGKGIGFGSKKGQIVDNDKIERCFLSMNHNDLNLFEQLLQYVPQNIMDVSEEVISFVQNELNEKLNNHIHVALTDHIHFMTTRIKQGIDIINPFMKEIAILYKEEYMIAVKVVKLLSKKLNITIPEDEAGFITLHIHSARNDSSVSDTLKYTRMYNDCIKVIEDNSDIVIDKKSINYARMITHLRFAVERLKTGEVCDNILLNSIKKQFPKEYKIASKVAEKIEATLNIKVPEDEIGYLVVHVYRLVKKVK